MAFAGYVFDAYGTLFDVHSAVGKHADTLGAKGAALSALWRTKQLEYSWVRSLMHSYTDFWTLTEEALDHAMEALDMADPNIRNTLLDAYWTLDAYPDVHKTLKVISDSGARVAILTNGSPDMIHAAIESAAIGGFVQDVFCVDAVKTFKTAPETYQMVTDSWDEKPKKVSFQSSNRWDIAGATKFGFETVWINRSNAADEYKRYPPSRTLDSLAELV